MSDESLFKMHIHLDIVGGIAGDMFASACMDAFPQLEKRVMNQLAAFMPKEAGEIKIWADVNGGIAVKRFGLKAQSSNDQDHDHNQVHHNDTQYASLKKRIETSSLYDSTKSIAIDILTILAEAEAKIHNTDLDHVHFHELADWDSLLDVVAAATILNHFSESTFSHSPIPLGGGLIHTQHGLLPTPAPATAEILTGMTFVDDGVQGERVTPTGAAILRYIVNNFPIKSANGKSLNHSGYGAGSKTFKAIPNILRVLVFNDAPKTSDPELSNGKTLEELVAVIECDIDDMTPEEMAVSLEYLRHTRGVVDITVNTARGKKNRSVEQLSIVARPGYLDSVKQACFSQTSTIGLRYQLIARTCLQRKKSETQVTGETVSIKSVERPHSNVTQKAESDSVAHYPSLSERRRVKFQAELDNIDADRNDTP